MHLQQTKRGSRATGGPQYYFHDLTDAVKTYLRKKGAVRVALVTPYGATKSDFFAVSAEHKLDERSQVTAGRVGHDRIQQGGAAASIGEEVRKWYMLPRGDFERIDVDVEVRDDVFYVTPLRCRYAGSGRERRLHRVERPLSFNRDYQSPFWRAHLDHVHRGAPSLFGWSLDEIARVVRDHVPGTALPHIQEPDLLRSSGPLRHLGVALGGYVGKGYDCLTEFSFRGLPTYTIHVEIKRFSRGFEYQLRKYGKDELTRAVVLCAVHDHRQLPPHIDVIELRALAGFARG
jgi:hypothetical protein